MKETFKQIIDHSPIPVLVDFTASWCGPCQAMAPALEQFANQEMGKVRILKIDIDQNRKAAEAFAIQAVPTFIVFKNGRQTWRRSGMQTISALKDAIQSQ